MWGAIAVGLVLAWHEAAGAQDVRAAARAGLGYDSNPVYVATRNAAVPGVSDPTAPSAYTGLDASALLAWGDRPRVALGLDGNARVYFTGETISFLRLGAGATTPVSARVLLTAQLDVTRFETSFSRDEATSGRLRFGALWAAAERLTLGVEGRAGVRGYDTGDQLDALAGGGFEARLQVGRIARLDGGLDVERRASDVLRATRWEVAPWLALHVDPTPTIRISASYALYVRDFDVVRRSGVEHLARVDARWMPWSALGFFVALEGGLARGSADALRYERLDVVLGIRAAFDSAPGNGPDHEGDDSSDATVGDGPTSFARHPGAIHFRIDAPGASRVAIVGTFNDWSESRGALHETSSGVFEADLDVPVGRQRYHVMIDDAAVRPVGARRYADDGFGGEDAVLERVAP